MSIEEDYNARKTFACCITLHNNISSSIEAYTNICAKTWPGNHAGSTSCRCEPPSRPTLVKSLLIFTWMRFFTAIV